MRQLDRHPAEPVAADAVQAASVERNLDAAIDAAQDAGAAPWGARARTRGREFFGSQAILVERLGSNCHLFGTNGTPNKSNRYGDRDPPYPMNPKETAMSHTTTLPAALLLSVCLLPVHAAFPQDADPSVPLGINPKGIIADACSMETVRHTDQNSSCIVKSVYSHLDLDARSKQEENQKHARALVPLGPVIAAGERQERCALPVVQRKEKRGEGQREAAGQSLAERAQQEASVEHLGVYRGEGRVHSVGYTAGRDGHCTWGYTAGR